MIITDLLVPKLNFKIISISFISRDNKIYKSKKFYYIKNKYRPFLTNKIQNFIIYNSFY